jgi:alpha-1,6-mannosyltransferase
MLTALLLILGAALISPNGDVKQIATLHRFWLGAGVMGLGFMLSWRLQTVPAFWFWGVAITARLLLFPMQPGDDLWRYLWEGQIQTLGFSPYDLPPNAPELIPYRAAWWSQINHPDVAAIYPPITQLGFRLLAAIAPTVYLFKLAFVLADLQICWLLGRRFGWLSATLYAWNPMIIYAFAGGAHYDSWLMLPLVLAWLSFEQDERFSWLWSAFWVGVSVAVKWISLPLLGFLVWRWLRLRRFGQAWVTGCVGLLPLLLASLLFCQRGCALIPTRSSFVAYGRSAEFIPHFVAQIWPASLQANWIYLLPLGLLIGWLMRRAAELRQFSESYLFGLLILSPIVHFWYFAWIMPFAVPTQNWGARLVSLSAFIYFVLPARVPDWRLSEIERLTIWLPFVLGWLWSASQARLSQFSSKT